MEYTVRRIITPCLHGSNHLVSSLATSFGCSALPPSNSARRNRTGVLYPSLAERHFSSELLNSCTQQRSPNGKKQPKTGENVRLTFRGTMKNLIRAGVEVRQFFLFWRSPSLEELYAMHHTTNRFGAKPKGRSDEPTHGPCIQDTHFRKARLSFQRLIVHMIY